MPCPAVISTPDDAALLRGTVWYFEDRLGREMPTDIEAYARAAGLCRCDLVSPRGVARAPL